MLKTYKILSLLLSYPGAELQNFLQEVEPLLRNDAILSPEKIDGIVRFVNHFRERELIDWQAEYVQLFDYSRSASLYLFEHIKGDSKDRGQAMVNMQEFYRENKMQLVAHELPDYIPAFLEFLSTLEHSRAAELLAEPVHIIQRIYLSLDEKKHPYKDLLAAIVSLSAKKPDGRAIHAVMKNEKPLDLDGEYEEEPVEFGQNHTCKQCKN